MKLIKLAKVQSMTSLGRSTIYKFISENKFPKPIKLGSKSVAWIEREILDWIEDRIFERDNAA